MGRFRFFAQRDTDPGHPADGIERQRRLRHRRELLGIYLDLPRLQVQASRVASIGSGRWSRFEPMDHEVLPLPERLMGTLLASFESSQRFALGERKQSASSSSAAAFNGTQSVREFSLNDYLSFSTDLAEWLAAPLARWAQWGGGSDDELLAIALHDSGWLCPDFDGQPRYPAPADPARLAEKGGWPVIAQMRSADLAASGQGAPLDPLPHWFLLADRSERIAISSRVIIRLDRDCQLLYLPASDGLDAEHPVIHRQPIEVWSLVIETLARLQGAAPQRVPIGQLAVQGRSIEALVSWLNLRSRDNSSRRSSAPSTAEGNAEAESFESLAGRLSLTLPDMARSALDWLVQQVVEFVRRPRDFAPAIDQLILIGPGIADGYFQQSLMRATGVATASLEQVSSWNSAAWDATLTATLGFLHLDQQPASLPWLTGADVPRLHGQLFPGHLGPWRRLVVEMADFRPPPMKLREAV